MNDIITQIGKYCSSQDIKNLRLVNKEWSEHISINKESIELTLNHSKITVINANTHYFNWLFKYLNKYYPKVHNITINFTEVNSILIPVNLISLFVNLFYWQDVQSKKQNLENTPKITLNLKTTSICLYHILNGLSSALINTASYHNFYYHDHPIQANPIILNVALLEGEFIDIMGVQSINSVYKLVSRVCVLSSIKLHLENHYLLFISPFCMSVKETLHVTSDNTIFEISPIHFEPFRHCPNIIVDLKIINNHIYGIEYITKLNYHLSYLNIDLMDRLLHINSRIRHLSLYSLIISNDQCNTFIDKFTTFIQMHPNEVSLSLYNINDIRNAYILHKILPHIKEICLVSNDTEDWVVSNILYYLMENPKIKLIWNIPDIQPVILSSKEDCLEYMKQNNNINIIWQFVKF